MACAAMELSVVVPVRNEAENLGLLVREISQSLERIGDYEIIYVDDGSTDDTLQKLRGLCQEFHRLRVLHHHHASGQSAALMTGIRAAKGMTIATLDGDGQNDPADIPRLLDELSKLLKGNPKSMVVGYRKHRCDTDWRKLTSRFANAVRGNLLGDHTPDTGCGLKVFPRELYLSLPCFDHMHRFLPALVQRNGGGVVSVEVNHRPRLHGKSNYGTWNRLWVGIVDMFGVMWLQNRSLQCEAWEIESIERNLR